MMHWPDGDYRWASAHIYFKGNIYSCECDRLIVELVKPMVQYCRSEAGVVAAFLVRYREDASHIRLRLRASSTDVRCRVMPAVERYVGQRYLLPCDGGASAGAAASTAGIGQVTSLRWVHYEPEIERYGGPDGVALAERMFCCSSDACMELLDREVSQAGKMGIALLTMTVSLFAFCNDQSTASVFAHDYSMRYLRSRVPRTDLIREWRRRFDAGYARQSDTLGVYAGDLWARLCEERTLSPSLDRYHMDLRTLVARLRSLLTAERLSCYGTLLSSWSDVVSRLVPSYVHMTNNRLGITLLEEAYLAHLLGLALSSSTTWSPSVGQES